MLQGLQNGELELRKRLDARFCLALGADYVCESLLGCPRWVFLCRTPLIYVCFRHVHRHKSVVGSAIDAPPLRVPCRLPIRHLGSKGW